LYCTFQLDVFVFFPFYPYDQSRSMLSSGTPSIFYTEFRPTWNQHLWYSSSATVRCTAAFGLVSSSSFHLPMVPVIWSCWDQGILPSVFYGIRSTELARQCSPIVAVLLLAVLVTAIGFASSTNVQ
jgi:hypothetical protein